MRERRGMNREDLARKIHRSIGGLTKIESGDRSLDQDWLELLSVALNCDAGGLLQPESVSSQMIEAFDIDDGAIDKAQQEDVVAMQLLRHVMRELADMPEDSLRAVQHFIEGLKAQAGAPNIRPPRPGRTS